MRDAYEKSQIPAMHTFSRLPGYFPRPHEEQAIIKILTGIPSFTVLFGASRSFLHYVCKGHIETVLVWERRLFYVKF